MVTEEGQETEVNDLETNEPPDNEQKPPTAEEQLATLQEEHNTLKSKYEQTEKGLNTAQATLTRKDQDLKKMSDLHSRMSTIEDSMEILAGLISKTSGDISPEDIPDYKQEFAKLKTKRDQEALSQIQKEYNEKADAIWSRAKESIKDKKDLKMVELLLLNGKPDDADDLVVEAEKEVTPVDKPPADEKKEASEQMEARIRKELEIKLGVRNTVTDQPKTGVGGKLRVGDFEAKKKQARTSKELLDSYKGTHV